ncbi:hypothetical protein CASFOL_023092 [Castilleja foliolosa]|uniref:NAB domain-containing protein n=1 Tax=Castilleja foliolosa TaxID=1961234 RepID=A0ABD3CKE7_9LAMI
MPIHGGGLAISGQSNPNGSNSAFKMEEKVQNMVKLIEEDGDSFVKRAEMYYKRRPELISNIEDSFKAFRALADRYDLLSRELQNANRTIATVFPEQVQFDMSDDFDDDCPIIPNIPPEISGPNVPQVPKAPQKKLKSIITKASKQLQVDKLKKPKVESGLTRDEALAEITKIHKDILALQTVKEFVKSSYESGLAKYWGIENQIMELQQKVSRLQDEFDLGTVIDDDEARTLMAEAALRSCRETLAVLQEKQEKSSREAKEEYERIEAACQKLQSLRLKYLPGRVDDDKKDELIQESKEIEMLPEKTTKESLDLSSVANLTVTQLAEKIDQLVNRVIGLETAVSSQIVLVNTLRTETDDLNDQIRDLEDENESMVDDTRKLGSRVAEMEGKLNKIQNLNKNVERQNSNLEVNFAEARSSLDCLSGKLSSVRPDVEVVDESDYLSHHEEIKGQKDFPSRQGMEDLKEANVDVHVFDQPVTSKGDVYKSNIKLDEKPMDLDVGENLHSLGHVNGEVEEKTTENDEDINWQQMLLSGMEDREKILLKEYTAILRNYKDVKKKLGEKEKNEKDSEFDMVVQIRELKQGIQMRDEEIQNLRQIVKENTSTTQPCISGTGNNDSDANRNDDDKMKLIFNDQTPSMSKVEEKLRTDIDAILDENLDFWMRFSAEFHQIQKFKTQVQDLQDEISNIREKRKPDGSFMKQTKSDARPIYKHLREIQRELSIWLEQSASLKDELKGRFASLCGIQEEIMKTLREGVEEDKIRFSSHQAAKFQGEILNMKQENNKVREELRTGFDLVRMLQLQIETTLKKLNEEFGISAEQAENVDRPRVPLRSFIFGSKPKKQKHSLFSCMHPNKRYQMPRTGIRLSNQNH